MLQCSRNSPNIFDSAQDCMMMQSTRSNVTVLYDYVLSCIRAFTFTVAIVFQIIDLILHHILLVVICGAAGLSLYAKNYLDDTRDADWSYIIGWLGVCLLGIGLVLLLLIFMRR